MNGGGGTRGTLLTISPRRALGALGTLRPRHGGVGSRGALRALGSGVSGIALRPLGARHHAVGAGRSRRALGTSRALGAGDGGVCASRPGYSLRTRGPGRSRLTRDSRRACRARGAHRTWLALRTRRALHALAIAGSVTPRSAVNRRRVADEDLAISSAVEDVPLGELVRGPGAKDCHVERRHWCSRNQRSRSWRSAFTNSSVTATISWSSPGSPGRPGPWRLRVQKGWRARSRSRRWAQWRRHGRRRSRPW